jgi:hypothetical protein
MTCYQSTNLPAGFSTTGRTSYKTEAECNQACKEGACCEGTTCTVKPQCQCQCTTGRCCGPDTTTAGGTTWKTCRNESKAACDARGGVFQCGVSCSQGVIGDASGSTGGSVCLNGTGDVANAGAVFKGVGTICARSGVCCKPSQLATATGGKQCSPIETICDCTSAGDAVNTTDGITCETANCFQCPCTAKTDFPVSITVSCHARRLGTVNRTCARRPGDGREPVYFVDVDVTFTQTLYLNSASGTTCRMPSYQSVNQRGYSNGGGVYANAVNGLEANGVRLEMYQEGSQCRVRGYFFYLAFSPAFDGGIASSDGVGALAGSVGGLTAGNDKFWDNAAGQVIQAGYEQTLLCYGPLKDQSTITIVSLNYLP